MNAIKRESNLELMRIVSMIFIVLYHIIIHCKFLERAEGASSFFLLLIESLILVHVNSYILLSGYFQCKSKFKMSKVLSLNNADWFYRIIYLILFSALGIVEADHISIFLGIMPFDYNNYWFINNYLLLYLMSPLLNRIITTCNRKQFKNIIIASFIIISVISTITMDCTVDAFSGRSIETFVLLYLIGAYIRLYPPEMWQKLKNWTREKCQLIYFLGYIFMALLSFMAVLLHQDMSPLGELMRFLGNIINNFHITFASPIIIIETVFYFLFFRTLTIKSKLINKISPACLGVYLISENYYVRTKLYDLLGITKIIVTRKVIILSILAAVCIFILCSMIELLRKWLFKKIYNTKLAKKNREFYRSYLEKLGFDISW